jgi:hypothetical protein
MCVHSCTLCKITAPTVKNCGNKSQIRLTHNICPFTPTFLPPRLFTKKHAAMGTFLNTFFSLFSTKKFQQKVKEAIPIQFCTQMRSFSIPQFSNHTLCIDVHNSILLLLSIHFISYLFFNIFTSNNFLSNSLATKVNEFFCCIFGTKFALSIQ